MIKWSLVFVCALALVRAQNGYPRKRPNDEFGFDNSAQNNQENYQDEEGNSGGEIPGEAGRDYPVYSEVPETSFSCSNQQYPGYYADPEAQCQAFYICQRGGKTDSFLCPNGTVFNQAYFVCDWWYNFDCNNAESLYNVNEQVLRAMEEADARLGQQGQGGYDAQSLRPDVAYGVPQRNGNGNGHDGGSHGNSRNGNGNAHNGRSNGNTYGLKGNSNGNNHGNGNGNGHHENGNNRGNNKHNGNEHNGQNTINSQYGAPSNQASPSGANSFNGGKTEADFSHGNQNDFGHASGNGHDSTIGNGYSNGIGISHNANGNNHSQNRYSQNGNGHNENGNDHHGNGNGGNGFRGNGNGFSNGNKNDLSAFRNGLGNGPTISGQTYQALQQNRFANGNQISSQYGTPNQGNGQNGFNGSPSSGNGQERSYLPPSEK